MDKKLVRVGVGGEEHGWYGPSHAGLSNKSSFSLPVSQEELEFLKRLSRLMKLHNQGREIFQVLDMEGV